MPPTLPTSIDVLIIAGPAGVGKSSVAHELSLQLQRADIPHVLIDTDELDRIHPAPPDLPRITERSLAALWSVYADEAVDRLILVGVRLDEPDEVRWISRALPDARFTLVRLTAGEEIILRRVRRREIGSGRQAQMERTRHQVSSVAARSPRGRSVDAGRSVQAIGGEIKSLWATATAPGSGL